MSIKWEPTAKKDRELRPYSGSLNLLDAADLSYFSSRYEIPEGMAAAHIRVARDCGKYALPIWDPAGIQRGVVLRQPWPGAPRSGGSGPKADTYKNTFGPLQSHYFTGADTPMVVVEDQLSAIKLAAYGYNSAALLGVPEVRYSGYSGVDRVTEIARRARSVIIALDNDMTEVAFLFVKKWAGMFDKLRVAILARDLKDTPASEFAKVLGI